MNYDLLQSLENFKEDIEVRFGKETPEEVGTVITPLSRLEERYHLFRQSLEEVLALKAEEG